MPKLNADKKTVFRGAFYLVLALDLLLILPLQAKGLVKLHSQMKKLSQDISDFQKEYARQDQKEKEKEDLGLELLSLDEKTVSIQDISSLSVYISDKAKQNDVEVLEIMPGQPVAYKTTDRGKFSSMDIKIEASGGYHNVGRFVNALESGIYFLSGKTLVVRKGARVHRLSLVVQAVVRE